MKLEDITVATADKFLQTYGGRKLHDYGAWWLAEFRPEYAAANGITAAEVPSRAIIRRYSEGHTPKSVIAIKRLEDAGVSFPLTPAQERFPELSNLAALVYFTGGILFTGGHKKTGYCPEVSISGFIDSKTISDLLPHVPFIVRPENVSGAGESARPRYLLSPLGRALYAMGIETGRKVYHKADFPEYILKLARHIRNPETGLLSQKDRAQLKSICYSFAQIFFRSKGSKRGGNLKLRIPARADKTTASAVTAQAQQFLSDLFNIRTTGRPEKRTTFLTSGEEREVYTPTIYIEEQQLKWLVTEYGNAGSGVIGISEFVLQKKSDTTS